MKYQPSIYVKRKPEESPREFIERVLQDRRLLPDQRDTLQQDLRYDSVLFDKYIQGVWIEQAPLP